MTGPMTRENLFAFTAPGSQYPGFVSINREPSGDITFHVRSAPKIVANSVFICAHKGDAGPGRCTPGDANCNNYCNMAPEKGPMKDGPMPCDQVIEGAQAVFTIKKDEWPGFPFIAPA